jgi:hypothetical protein
MSSTAQVQTTELIITNIRSFLSPKVQKHIHERKEGYNTPAEDEWALFNEYAGSAPMFDFENRDFDPSQFVLEPENNTASMADTAIATSS